MTLRHDELVEISLANARENRMEFAWWLAVEILLSAPDALQDDDLVDRLCALQDRLEELARVRHGLPAAAPRPPAETITAPGPRAN